MKLRHFEGTGASRSSMATWLGGLGSCMSICLLSACGGGGGGSTGSLENSGPTKTYLSVDAADADGDTLTYQWRVTGGKVENRNARETVWTMPDGPGLHFAYVTVSDGKGGYAEQQYAVTTDALGTAAPVKPPITRASTFAGTEGGTGRLRLLRTDYSFVDPAGGAPKPRFVYLANAPVEVRDGAVVVYAGSTDWLGEASLPQLATNKTYSVFCAANAGDPLINCATGGLTPTAASYLSEIAVPVDPTMNLRLFGHVAFTDGAPCGVQNEFFGIQSAASVQLLDSNNAALSQTVSINRYGDYALDAAVLVSATYKLKVSCEAYTTTLAVPAAPTAAGYLGSGAAIEVSYGIPNRRPAISKMVGSGADGNVRGKMIVPEVDASSNALPGEEHFLTYKGKDTKLGACMYYKAIGAAGGCDAQGNLVDPLSFDDWKRAKKLAPYNAGNTDVAANYINKMDLNLMRRMVATQTAPNDISYYVCNSPGPETTSQAEVNAIVSDALSDLRKVACVAMEWSVTPGSNGDQPFTKFLTFGPDGSLLPSINLDGRGEKFMPGTCVACHGGSAYNGRFPEKGNPSPDIGARFLPFDTNNYLFSTDAALTEPAQTEAFYKLNQLVKATEAVEVLRTADSTRITRLIDGWYAHGHTLDKTYLPGPWNQDPQAAGTGPSATTRADRALFYHEVVGASCRTCHVAMTKGDWDNTLLDPELFNTRAHACGGTANLALNASMPNALISRDRVLQKVRTNPALAQLMRTYLGCTEPLADPAYVRR